MNAQVPLLLKIRLVSVKGTCIVSLRAPPSDRIWFSFKEMPDIDMAPEPCIRDIRMRIGPLGTFIADQIKVLLESLCLFTAKSILFALVLSHFSNWKMYEVYRVCRQLVENKLFHYLGREIFFLI